MKDTQRNGIDKLTAHLLAGHEYKLVDKEGTTTFTITGIMDDTLYLIDEENTPHYFRFDEAGTDFFVLCRPYSSLTKEVNGVVPIVELANIENENEEINEIENLHANKVGDVFWVDYYDQEEILVRFCYCVDSFQKGYVYDKSHYAVQNQESLLNKLYSLHFKPSSLPDEYCKFIND